MRPRQILATLGKAAEATRYLRWALRELSQGYAGDDSVPVHAETKAARRAEQVWGSREGPWDQAAFDA